MLGGAGSPQDNRRLHFGRVIWVGRWVQLQTLTAKALKCVIAKAFFETRVETRKFPRPDLRRRTFVTVIWSQARKVSLAIVLLIVVLNAIIRIIIQLCGCIQCRLALL